MNSNNIIDALFDKLERVKEELEVEGLKEIERQARRILKRNPKRIESFMMCMGTFCFFCSDGSQISDDREFQAVSGGSELFNLILRLDDELKITGNSISFTKDSETKTNW